MAPDPHTGWEARPWLRLAELWEWARDALVLGTFSAVSEPRSRLGSVSVSLCVCPSVRTSPWDMVVRWLWHTFSLCASSHPQELRFLSLLSREEAKTGEGQGHARGEVATRTPRSESGLLPVPTLQDRLPENLLRFVGPLRRTRPNGVVVAGHRF